MAQLVRKSPLGKLTTQDLGRHEKGVWDFSPEGGKFDKNVWLRSTSKSPKELSEEIQKENNYYRDNATSPLADFKIFENALIYPSDDLHLRERYGVNERSIPYTEYLNEFAKSKGKFASQYQDPEIQKYFNDRLNYRQKLFDRVKKIPEDKFQDFAHGYGFYADPFDYEDDAYVSPKDTDEFLSWFDEYPIDWETLESYLEEEGY